MSNTLLCKAADKHQAIQHAATMLRDGRLVAFPTETVYGLGALAHDDAAIAGIFRVKGRPAHNPLILHVRDRQMAERYGIFNDVAATLAEAFFPSALSLVMPVRDGSVSPLVLAGGDTVALRAPQHPVAQALLQAVDAAIAAPSANRSGKISPTCAQHVLDEFHGDAMAEAAIGMVLDDSATSIGVESTVVECLADGARILRPGSITADALRAYVPVHETATQRNIVKSPGLLGAHYAPNASLRLNATTIHADEALLAFGKPLSGTMRAMKNLSESADLHEAATHLYAYLRELDATHDKIAVMPVSEHGIGAAINDRLRRAAMTDEARPNGANLTQ